MSLLRLSRPIREGHCGPDVPPLVPRCCAAFCVCVRACLMLPLAVMLWLQAFQETIEIFQQKNESFKNALKEVGEVSASVATHFFSPIWFNLTPACLRDLALVDVPADGRAGQASASMDPRQRGHHVHEVQRAFQRSDEAAASLQGLRLCESTPQRTSTVCPPGAAQCTLYKLHSQLAVVYKCSNLSKHLTYYQLKC